MKKIFLFLFCFVAVQSVRQYPHINDVRIESKYDMMNLAIDSFKYKLFENTLEEEPVASYSYALLAIIFYEQGNESELVEYFLKKVSYNLDNKKLDDYSLKEYEKELSLRKISEISEILENIQIAAKSTSVSSGEENAERYKDKHTNRKDKEIILERHSEEVNEKSYSKAAYAQITKSKANPISLSNNDVVKSSSLNKISKDEVYSKMKEQYIGDVKAICRELKISQNQILFYDNDIEKSLIGQINGVANLKNLRRGSSYDLSFERRGNAKEDILIQMTFDENYHNFSNLKANKIVEIISEGVRRYGVLNGISINNRVPIDYKKKLRYNVSIDVYGPRLDSMVYKGELGNSKTISVNNGKIRELCIISKQNKVLAPQISGLIGNNIVVKLKEEGFNIKESEVNYIETNNKNYHIGLSIFMDNIFEDDFMHYQEKSHYIKAKIEVLKKLLDELGDTGCY